MQYSIHELQSVDKSRNVTFESSSQVILFIQLLLQAITFVDKLLQLKILVLKNTKSDNRIIAMFDRDFIHDFDV